MVMLSGLESASREELLALNGLTMTEVPDVTEDHVPAVCRDCGDSLDVDDSMGFERRQVRDIPLSTVTMTEHRAHRCRCVCGTVTTESMPGQVAGSPSSYGPNLRALAVYLLVFVRNEVSRRRAGVSPDPPTDICG
ncbi:hypothetical protein [Streptomyces sp. NPDC057910]|uniref:hypothetical protein n=1 Tax=Streptomyces sp. NPDC057910 TaxID=3346278 RepID=UPI0036EA7DF6